MMTRRVAIVVCANVWCALTLTNVGIARTWTDRMGNRVEGDFIEFVEGIVRIRRTSDDKVCDVRVERLCDDDHEFISMRIGPVKRGQANGFRLIVDQGRMRQKQGMTYCDAPVLDSIAVKLAFREDALTNPLSHYAIALSVARMNACEAAVKWELGGNGKHKMAAIKAWTDAIEANTREAFLAVSDAAHVAENVGMTYQGRPLVAADLAEVIGEPGALRIKANRKKVQDAAARIRSLEATLRN